MILPSPDLKPPSWPTFTNERAEVSRSFRKGWETQAQCSAVSHVVGVSAKALGQVLQRSCQKET